MNEQQELIERIAIALTRLDNHEKDVKILYRKYDELSHGVNNSEIAVQTILVKLENMSDQMSEMNNTLKVLSDKPSKNLDNITTTIITGVIGAIVGFITFKLTGN